MGKKTQEEYVVEKIVGKRMLKKKPYYYVKWKDYPTEQNTWEPIEHLEDCLDMIAEFEEEQQSQKKKTFNDSKLKLDSSLQHENDTSLNNKSLNGKANHSFGPAKNLAGVELDDCEDPKKSKKKKRESVPTKNGFIRGLKAESILAAVENDGVYCFLIKWHNLEEPELVPAKEAHVYCPQLVIQFYETKILWKPIRAK